MTITTVITIATMITIVTVITIATVIIIVTVITLATVIIIATVVTSGLSASSNLPLRFMTYSVFGGTP